MNTHFLRMTTRLPNGRRAFRPPFFIDSAGYLGINTSFPRDVRIMWNFTMPWSRRGLGDEDLDCAVGSGHDDHQIKRIYVEHLRKMGDGPRRRELIALWGLQDELTDNELRWDRRKLEARGVYA